MITKPTIKEARIAFQNEIARIAAEKEADRRLILERAKEEGVGIVHIFDKEYPQGGLTVAFKKVSPYRRGRMVEVAVATCSPEDVFSKRIGTHLALEAFFYGTTMELPLLIGYPEEDVNGAVKTAFMAMMGYDYLV